MVRFYIILFFFVKKKNPKRGNANVITNFNFEITSH